MVFLLLLCAASWLLPHQSSPPLGLARPRIMDGLLLSEDFTFPLSVMSPGFGLGASLLGVILRVLSLCIRT